MSYYNQGGGYYGGGGSQQPPDPSTQQQQQQQQQQPYGYAGVYGQQQQPPQQQQSYSAGDPYAAPQQPQYNEQPQHANIWQNQAPQQQQQQYPQQQQQQQQPPYGSSSSYSNNTPNIFAAPQPFFNPNMMAAAAMAASSLAGGGTGNNAGGTNALLDVGYAAGQSFLQNSTARMVPGLESTVRTLRPYFAVDNRYVLQKMKRVAVPFFYKSWKRTVRLHRVSCIHVLLYVWCEKCVQRRQTTMQLVACIRIPQKNPWSSYCGRAGMLLL
jgi:hypothetical protein